MKKIQKIITALAEFTDSKNQDVEEFIYNGIEKYKKIRLVRENDELFRPFEKRCEKCLPTLIEYYKHINVSVCCIVPAYGQAGLYVEFNNTKKRVLAVSEDALGDDYERFLGYFNTCKYTSGYVLAILAEYKNISIPELLTEIETWVANNTLINE